MTTIDELKAQHEEIRKILIDYGFEEHENTYSINIIDEICKAIILLPTPPLAPLPHEEIRKILIDYGFEECEEGVGISNCLIDEICKAIC